jgi:hypothetical protein
MGMDVYGLNPKIHEGTKKPERPKDMHKGASRVVIDKYFKEEQKTKSSSVLSHHQLLSTNLDCPPNESIHELSVGADALAYLGDFIDQLETFLLGVFIYQVPDFFFMISVELGCFVIINNAIHSSAAAVCRDV